MHATIAGHRALATRLRGALLLDVIDQLVRRRTAHALLLEQLVEEQASVGVDLDVGLQHAAKVAMVRVDVNYMPRLRVGVEACRDLAEFHPDGEQNINVLEDALRGNARLRAEAPADGERMVFGHRALAGDAR